MDADIDAKVTKKRQLESEIKQKQTQRSTLGMEMRELKTQCADQIAASGEFQEAPKGPVGQYVTLKGDRTNYAKLVECEIGEPLIRSYVVSCSRDWNVLQQIFCRVYGEKSREPTNFVTQFSNRRYQVRMFIVFDIFCPSLLLI